jgi:hypothetical protein
MPTELSHNLPWLRTSGNRILRIDTSQPVLLRGVNRSGLEYTQPSEAGFLAAAQCTIGEIQAIVTGWGANIIRLPFNQDWALNGANGHSAEEYLSALDQVISWAAALGAYTILDLQWLDAGTVYGHTKDANGVTEANHVPPTPNPYTIDLWSILARRYRDEPAALFDLLNEPHDRLDDDFLPIYLVAPDGTIIPSDSDSVGPDEWMPWVDGLPTRYEASARTGLSWWAARTGLSISAVFGWMRLISYTPPTSTPTVRITHGIRLSAAPPKCPFLSGSGVGTTATSTLEGI